MFARPLFLAATALAIWLASLGQCRSADPLNPPPPAIDGPDSVPAYKLLRLKLNAPADSAVWFVEPADAVDVVEQPGGLAIAMVAPPGTYTVNAVWLKGSVLGQGRKVVAIANANPIPPGPGPDPDPGKKGSSPIPAGRLWLIAVIKDVTRQTPEQAAIKASPDLHKLLDAQGNHFRWVNPQTAPSELAPWVGQAVGEGLPRVIVIDGEAQGSVVKEWAPLPASPAAMLDLLRKWSK